MVKNSVAGRSTAATAGWFVQADPRTGHVHMAWGGDAFAANGVRSGAEAESAAREFLISRGDLLGIRPDNLQLLSVNQAKGKWVAHFGQVVDGLPVWRAKAFVLMGESGRVIGWGSDFVAEDRHSAAPRATLSEAEAIATAAAALGTTPRADRPVEAETWVVPAPRGEGMEPVPAVRVRFEADEPFGKWETFVDAETGAILARRNLYHRVNVVGTVEGDVQTFRRPTAGATGRPRRRSSTSRSVSTAGTATTRTPWATSRSRTAASAPSRSRRS